MNVDPRGFTSPISWVEATLLPLAKLTVAPRLLSDDRWKDWAYAVVQTPSVSKLTPPDPRYFDDWSDWAFRFNQAVPL